MKPRPGHPNPSFSIRPLVRYVDETQAVVDVHVTVQSHNAHDQESFYSDLPLVVHLQVEGEGRTVYEHESRLEVHEHGGSLRFEMDEPQRWWPSGMGDQVLYDLAVNILADDELAKQWQTTIGLTSVRPIHGEAVTYVELDERAARSRPPEELTNLLVNGRRIEIRSIIPVYPPDEQGILPIVEHCLLVVRGHWGPDLLYNAADRAGTLLIQSIPEKKDHDSDLRSQVDRLAGHPSLAGWLVTKTHKHGDRIANRIHALDPTRNVFRHLPGS